MNKLPKLSELYDGDLPLKATQNAFNVLVNQPPNEAWIKDHPIAKGVKYIPIERIEYLLTKLFLKWRVEVKEIKLIGNSVCCTIRLHYQNIEDNEWSWQDGVGAMPLQVDKDHGATDFNYLKSDAVMKAAPAAESYAVKDASEKIGKIFGKDINRKDEIGYDSMVDSIPVEKLSITQFMMATELVRTSTLGEDSKEEVERELARKDLTTAELSAIINKLKENQPRKY